MDGTVPIGRLLRLAGLGPRGRPEESERPYACLGCGTGYSVEYHVCPNCGGFSVERTLDPGADPSVE
jgi:hypothetical protein